MDNTELTAQQTSDLVHYLKSWGIDDPILLAEMTDHYSDKALEMMDNGKSLEEVLNSWRTKSMFRTLKEIELKYDHEINLAKDGEYILNIFSEENTFNEQVKVIVKLPIKKNENPKLEVTRPPLSENIVTSKLNNINVLR